MACASGDEPSVEPGGTPADSQAPIAMMASQGATSRASGSPLNDTYTTFALVGYKKVGGTNQHVFSRNAEGTEPYKVMYSGGSWIYEGITYSDNKKQYLKYWDLSATSYIFSAYAPYEATGKGTPSVDADGNITISGLYSTGSSAYDWLESRYQRTNTPRDKDLISEDIYMPGTMSAVVPLTFHHVLSKVVFKIYNAEGTPVKINNFKVTLADGNVLHTGADYTYPDKYSYKSSVDISEICDKSYTSMWTGTKSADATELYSTWVMPQTLEGIDANININYGFDYTVSATIPLGAVDLNNRWEKDNIYVYVLVIGDIGSDKLILVNVQISPWTVADVTDPNVQNNW